MSLRALVTRARVTRTRVIPNPRFPLIIPPRRLPPRARAAAAAAWRRRRGGGGMHASARVIFHVIAHVRDARVRHSRAHLPEPGFPLLSSLCCPPRACARGGGGGGGDGGGTRARRLDDATARVIARIIARAYVSRVRHSSACYPEPPLPSRRPLCRPL